MNELKPSVTLFWDKNVSRMIPQSLRLLKLGIGTEIYLEHYPFADKVQERGDDLWLPMVGENNWCAITQDWSLHVKQNEFYAIKYYKVGCFYLWGAQEKKWEITRCFARGYDNILRAIEETPKPFIYWVNKNGTLRRQELP